MDSQSAVNGRYLKSSEVKVLTGVFGKLATVLVISHIAQDQCNLRVTLLISLSTLFFAR